MWARVVEVMLACWLAMSPFIFSHSFDRPLLWWNDLGCALLMMTLSFLSFHPRCRYLHLLNLALGLWLVGFGYVMAVPPADPAFQNEIFVGLLLLMFALLPNHATLPPQAWQDRNAQGNPS